MKVESPPKEKGPLIAAPSDSELLEFLSQHVTAYSSGPGKGRFGFDFNTSLHSSEKYSSSFREEIILHMKGRK